MSDTPNTENTETPATFDDFLASGGFSLVDGQKSDPAIGTAFANVVKTGETAILVACDASDDALAMLVQKAQDYTETTGNVVNVVKSTKTVNSIKSTIKTRIGKAKGVALVADVVKYPAADGSPVNVGVRIVRH